MPHNDQAKWKELKSQGTFGKDPIYLFLKNLILKLAVVSSTEDFSNVLKLSWYTVWKRQYLLSLI